MTDKVLDGVKRAQAAIINEVRAQVAAGREPDVAEVEARLRAPGNHARSTASEEQAAAIDGAERVAVERFRGVMGVHRARERLAREPAPAPPPPVTPRPSLRTALRTRPTITGNLDVRRAESADTLILTWEAPAGVGDWEVRFSERPSPRTDYAVIETLTLPAEATRVEVPLGEKPFRVTILGRGRDGRPRCRALISGLTKGSWNERWERRATAS
jgi:hypothetical protein